MNGTLNTKLAETPTIKRKNGITKSARVTPNHGEWFMDGKAFPASSTKIINCQTNHIKKTKVRRKEIKVSKTTKRKKHMKSLKTHHLTKKIKRKDKSIIDARIRNRHVRNFQFPIFR